MENEHHDLIHEFPEYRDIIHDLKVGDAHFAKLFNEYHEVDREVRRIEQRIELTSEEEHNHVRQRRMTLKDELYRMLKNHAEGASK